MTTTQWTDPVITSSGQAIHTLVRLRCANGNYLKYTKYTRVHKVSSNKVLFSSSANQWNWSWFQLTLSAFLLLDSCTARNCGMHGSARCMTGSCAEALTPRHFIQFSFLPSCMETINPLCFFCHCSDLVMLGAVSDMVRSSFQQFSICGWEFFKENHIAVVFQLVCVGIMSWWGRALSDSST